MMAIDTNFDFRTKLKDKETPDADSPILKSYHKKIWNKKLPKSSIIFKLDDEIETKDTFIFQTGSVSIRLSSDWMVNTYLHWTHISNINKIRERVNDKDFINFEYFANTIGNFIIFPKYQNCSGKQTMNSQRGIDKKIQDRFDLSLECIRRYYYKKENPSYNKENPLYNILKDFDCYFDLFIDFKNFCDFFFLQDLTTDNYSKIKYFLHFEKFEDDPYPKDIDEFNKYMKNAVKFIKRRGERIDNEFKNSSL